MLLHLPTTVSEAQECMARDAVPIGGATLVWAGWQRDGFPEHAMSLRELPEANGIEREALGAAVVLHRIDDRVPEALRRAATSVGTGAVRRTATVGGNLVGSALRCLLPAALVLDARAVTLEPDGVYETDLSDALTKHHLLLGIRWREPIASGYRKQPAEAGGPPPLVVATAVHADPVGERRLRVAVRDGYDVLSATVPCDAGSEQALHALESTGVGTLPAAARDVVREQVSGIVAGLAGS
ncbi:FAD binding domain-containing protein [Streptomyces sp. NPDC046977]|uniref:FAD binding domain-containing protein n=1 Tax=Streptomyces sp. NPDC046977 TaxID=3154703 RepID=UPI0033C951D1